MARRAIRPAGPALALAALAAALTVGVVGAQDAQPTYDSMIAFTDRAAMSASIDSIADGVVTFQSPNFLAPVRSPLGSLSKLTFSSQRGQAAAQYLIVTNGDRIGGTWTGMDDEYVFFEAPPMGTVKVPLRAVAKIAPARTFDALIDTNFADEGLGQWRAVQGEWRVQDGALVNVGGAAPQTVAHALQTDGPFTLDLEADGGRQTAFYLTLFGDDPEADAPAGLYLIVMMHTWHMIVVDGKESAMVGTGRFDMQRQESGGRFTINWDPETREITMWARGAQVHKGKVPDSLNARKDGFLIVRPQARMKWEFIRVLPRVLSPAEIDKELGALEVGQAPEKTTVMLRNKDRMTATRLLAKEGRAVIEVNGVDVSVPLDDVLRVVFGKGEQEVPRRQKGDARVKAGASAITLLPEYLDDDVLKGTSDYLGEVSIQRSGLAEIEFNVHE